MASRTSQRVKTPKDIAMIAKKLKIPFYHFPEWKDLAHVSPVELRFGRLYREALILITGNALRAGADHDLVLSYKDAAFRLDWNDWSVPCLTNALLDDNQKTCSICFEPSRFGVKYNCDECSFSTCALCTFKLMFDENGRFQMNWRKQGQSQYQCPQCRKTHVTHIVHMYLTLFDQWDELSKNERDILTLYQERDPFGKRRLKEWNALKKLKKGAKVQIRGMENRTDLNWEYGTIVGESKSKEGITRWPVQLMYPKVETMFLIKVQNLERSCHPREIPVFYD